MLLSDFVYRSVLVVCVLATPALGQEVTPTPDVDLNGDGEVSAEDVFAFIDQWYDVIESATPTPTSTPTSQPPTETPTPTATEAQSGMAFAVSDYFVLSPGSNWTFGTPSKGIVGDGFTWIVLDEPVDLGDGVLVNSIRTTAFLTDHVRHLDEDFWSIDETTGHLLFHGIREAVGFELDLKGVALEIPPQDFILDPPVDFGGADLSIGDIIGTTASIAVNAIVPPFGEQVINATAFATVAYSELLPTFSTTLGEFTNVIKLTVNIRAVVDFGISDFEVEFLDNSFFLKEGIGLVAIDLDPDPVNADLLTLSAGTVFVDGNPITVSPE